MNYIRLVAAAVAVIATAGAAGAQSAAPSADQIAQLLASEMGGRVPVTDIRIEDLQCRDGGAGADCDFVARLTDGPSFACDLNDYTVNGGARPSCDPI